MAGTLSFESEAYCTKKYVLANSHVVAAIALRARSVVFGELNLLPQRVAFRPKLLGECFVDNCNRWSFGLVRFVRGEGAPAKDGKANRGKIIGADAVISGTIGQSFRGTGRLLIRRHMHAGALHCHIHGEHTERGGGGYAHVLDAGKSSQPLIQRPVNLLGLLLICAGQTGVDFKQQVVLRAQSGIKTGGFVCAADEQGRRRQQRQRKSDLHDDQWMARQEPPAA